MSRTELISQKLTKTSACVVDDTNAGHEDGAWRGKERCPHHHDCDWRTSLSLSEMSQS